MQHPLLGVLDGSGDGAEQRSARAWGKVADGYRAALSELCPSDESYDRLRRCLRHAEQLAGRPLLSLAQSPLRGQAAG